ncbi:MULTISPECIES: hypothetical protein [unclassified Coleofasciculus]|uniref:hypothetical protein n=1 Tax=unclassified Coleofasciculus TaxID=2692782 RepID=UPI00187E52B6|nr:MULTISPECIES: hypothetical protein [unclassified Coleofasciculus]MBE9124786.1 hypothetical protein [Coleofasciculus sp. LEGE 07081]MBE9147690.1 hypothetical protein [Coleofasciculus sp. LEGE 07092]
MYPEFIKQAEAEGNKDAVQTLTYAVEAEAQHAKLYREAQNNLEAWREAQKPFYVCTASGENGSVTTALLTKTKGRVTSDNNEWQKNFDARW